MQMSAMGKVAAGMGAALLTGGAVAGVALAVPQVAADAGGAGGAVAIEREAGGVLCESVALDRVEGTFGFTQGEVSTNDWIHRNLAEGSRYVCGAHAAAASDPAATKDWPITVDGAVDCGYSATIGEICASSAVQALVMGCACLGNPADGRSVANALVQGVSAQVLIAMANPREGANTVVFTSSDGYQVALPLSYIETHYCPVVFNVNGSALEESVGGTNQLWLGSTPASYFVRDVVAVTLEERAEIPTSPTSDEARAEYGANLPNVGILLGGEVA